ncbi:hypothetical protein P692DRAFT_20844482 [Suillus brevipes Sb2]|nr:hypothetical protein P692DRAFT_20844482 [Suillus brevipes Sb2]
MEKQGGALDWSKEYNTEFEVRVRSAENPNKTVPTPRVPITIHDHTIQPSKSHKFLGVIIDENLNFKEQAAHALAKGTKYVLACSRMIRLMKGIHGKLMKKLYERVIVLKMLYAADVWCAGLVEKGRGKKGRGRGARGFASQMARVQRMAIISISGGLRSSPTDMLDVHANKRPLAKGIKNAYDYGKERDVKGKKRYPSPLHKLVYKFRINPSKVEKIDPVRHYPKWEPDVDIHIAEKAETAKIEDRLADENLRAYSDGSMVDGG